MAAHIPQSFDDCYAEEFYANNVALTRNAVGFAAMHGASFVYASSTSVYGPNPRPPVVESSSLDPDNDYSRGKAAGEDIVTEYGRKFSVPVSSLRISAPYGPRQSTRTVVQIFLERVKRNQTVLVHGTGSRYLQSSWRGPYGAEIRRLDTGN